jgi:hypothetical protein
LLEDVSCVSSQIIETLQHAGQGPAVVASFRLRPLISSIRWRRLNFYQNAFIFRALQMRFLQGWYAQNASCAKTRTALQRFMRKFAQMQRLARAQRFAARA